MPASAELPVLHCASQADWDRWLAQNHATAPGVWLQLAKKASDATSVSYSEAIEVALCYGWIDSQKRAQDSHFSQQRFSPRARRGLWSAVNREKASKLLAAGRLQPAGLLAVEQAQADGRWDAAYAPQRTAEVPPDLQQALAANPEAQAFFATLGGANRYAVLFRIQTAKLPATRAARIEKFVAMLARRETIHPAARSAKPDARSQGRDADVEPTLVTE